MSENTDTGTGSQESSEESSVIQTLRADLKAAKAEVKAARSDGDEALATARAQVKREAEAASLMSEAGFKGLADVFAAEVDGDLTEEAASQWLKTRGLEASSDSGESSADPATQVGEVADLGSQVAAASGDVAQQNFGKRIDELEANAGGSLESFLDGLQNME